jgi:hypothetical protein
MELTEITLKMIVESGLLKPETTIYSSTKPPVSGKINNDGSITISFNRKFTSLSGAAKAITDSSVNGWRFWRVRIGDEYKELTFFREEYKKLFDKTDLSINE